jgi:hypothetical protein
MLLRVLDFSRLRSGETTQKLSVGLGIDLYETLPVQQGLLSMGILEQNHQRVSILGHDPLLYEDDEEMLDYVAQALGSAPERLLPCSNRSRWTQLSEDDRASLPTGCQHL